MLLERMVCRPGVPARARSRGIVICCSTSSEASPGAWVDHLGGDVADVGISLDRHSRPGVIAKARKHEGDHDHDEPLAKADADDPLNH